MVIAFTGAGISKPSGIPTFEDQGDMRYKLDRGFATEHPEEFKNLLESIKEQYKSAEPNEAHLALARAKIPVITMNIDGLHGKANDIVTKEMEGKTKRPFQHAPVIEVHGNIYKNNVVLYGDPAPMYSNAFEWIYRLEPGDKILIIGTSYFTNFSSMVKDICTRYNVDIIEINANAEIEVPKAIENLKASDFGSIYSFMQRDYVG